MAKLTTSWTMPFSMRQTGWGVDPDTGNHTMEIAVSLRRWHPRLWWWAVCSLVKG
jgi:hypothetical protein